MLQELWNYFKRNLSGFWPGAIGGGAVWSIILFPAKIFLSGVVLETIGKLMMVAALAIITGLCKVLGEDVYKQYIKNKLFKNKTGKNERQKQDDKAA